MATLRDPFADRDIHVPEEFVPVDVSATTDQLGDSPLGVNVGSLSSWFDTHVAGVRLPLRFSLISGGRSNLTYLVEDGAAQRFVLRRPPVGHLLPTAHDMAREHRIISALAPAGIPVAPTLGLCEDPAVNGAPFYVMGFVDGVIARSPADANHFDEAARRRIGLTLVDTLAHIHSLDPDEVGLGDLGRKESYVARQLKRWSANYVAACEDRGGRPSEEMIRLFDTLSQHIPEQGPAAIVHGDYKLANCVVSPDGREVRAVLDWELCTLGDALADVGAMLVYWTEPGDRSPIGDDEVTMAPGFATRDELVSRYAEQSGRDIGHLDFYVAFAYWRLACVLEGVYARYGRGAMGDDDFDPSSYPETISWLAARARQTVRRLSR